MSTMKAVRIHAYGGPEVLQYEDAPLPVVLENDVLVRVHAAGVNPVDWKVRQGLLRQHIPFVLPMIPGWDVAGVVERVGPGVAGFAPGDEVFARPDLHRNGAYAEFVTVRAAELARKPRSLDFEQAAAVPLAALTAFQALFEAPAPYTSASITSGQTVLVHAGAGGVGSFAVQLARWRGARVLATASARNEQVVRDLGADEVIDYTRVRFEDVVRDCDVVFDTIGGDTQGRSWKALKPGGVLVSVVSPPSADEAKAHSARAAYVFVQPDAGQLSEIGQLVDAGRVKPLVSEVFPLAEARRAQELSESGHARGKLVLHVR